MKVLFYSPLAVLANHHETDLELMKLHLDKGDEVILIDCKGDLRQVGLSTCLGIGRCHLCVSRQKEGQALIASKGLTSVTIKLEQAPKTDWKFTSKAALHNISYKGVDIGSAVLSTIISNLREPDPDLIKMHKAVSNMLDGMVHLTDFCEAVLASQKFDRIYLFNGRYTLYRPMLRLAQKNNIECIVHERAGTLSKYSLSYNTYPHDIQYMKSAIHAFWDTSELSESKRLEIGDQWFKTRQSGINQAWFSFSDDQKEGMLPKHFDKSKRNVSIYISSEDEFEAIEGWANPLFKNQAEGVEYILNRITDENFHFYIRIHPNLKGLVNSQTTRIASWNFKNATIIPADAEINSYSLLISSEKVITFGSTIGSEAVYANVPSILVGRALYENFSGLIIPGTKEQFLKEVLSSQEKPSNVDMLKFGFWASEYGIKFKYYAPTNLSNGPFMGHQITGGSFVFAYAYTFTFFHNLYLVLTGRMDMGYLKNKVLNKLKS